MEDRHTREHDRVEFVAADSTARLADLSPSGACIFRSEVLDRNSFVKIRIGELVLRAKVIYSRKRTDDFRIGMQFWNVLPEKRIALNDMVERFSKGVPLECRILGGNGDPDMEDRT